jgi:hypothetical protein
MWFYLIGAVVVILLVVLVLLARGAFAGESFRSCRTCEQGGWLGPSLNPFVYPNSGESCPELYMAVHRNTPDHVPPE